MSIIYDLSRPDEQVAINIKDKFTSAEICNAFTKTLTYIIADAFDLNSEETILIRYQIAHIMNGFASIKPKSLPNAVTHELKTKQYSKAITDREQGSYLIGREGLKPAEIDEWVDVIMEMISNSYDPAWMIQAETRAEFITLLSSLGIGGMKNPRAALYLPNSIKWNAAQKKETF